MTTSRVGQTGRGRRRRHLCGDSKSAELEPNGPAGAGGGGSGCGTGEVADGTRSWGGASPAHVTRLGDTRGRGYARRSHGSHLGKGCRRDGKRRARAGASASRHVRVTLHVVPVDKRDAKIAGGPGDGKAAGAGHADAEGGAQCGPGPRPVPIGREAPALRCSVRRAGSGFGFGAPGIAARTPGPRPWKPRRCCCTVWGAQVGHPVSPWGLQ